MAELKARALVALLGGEPDEPIGFVNIKREGDQITLPPNMEYNEAITWLERKRDEESTQIEVNERLEGFAFDAANAFNLAVKEMFGMTAMDAFRNQSQNVQVDADGNMISVYLGKMEIPSIKGKVNIYVESSWDVIINFVILQKDKPKIDKLMALARKYVSEKSIYRGKAFRLGWKPATMWAPAGFADPAFIKTGIRNQMQVNDETLDLIQAAVWTPIQQADRCRQLHIPLKRAALLEGPYGTGKTLLSAETATIAEQHGWTFIYLTEIGKLAEAYQAARKYAPAVVFAEDVDLLVDADDDEIPEAVRNTLDGIDTKNSEVIVILTTNHVEKLPKSILRPGRLDTIIPFETPNAKTVQKLIRQYAGGLLSSNVRLDAAGNILAGKIPAVIREVVERAKLFCMSRSEEFQLEEVDLTKAAVSMQSHFDLMDTDKSDEPSAMEVFGESLGKSLVVAASAAIKDNGAVNVVHKYVDAYANEVEDAVLKLGSGNGIRS